jgi:hypothetical protein
VAIGWHGPTMPQKTALASRNEFTKSCDKTADSILGSVDPVLAHWPRPLRPGPDHSRGVAVVEHGARSRCATDPRVITTVSMFPNVERDPPGRRLGSAAYVVRTGSVTPKPPAFWGPKERRMVLALRPPVRAISIRARERYDDVLARVPVCDGRSMTRFVRSCANQRRDRECIDNPPHDLPLFQTPARSSFLAQSHNRQRLSA